MKNENVNAKPLDGRNIDPEDNCYNLKSEKRRLLQLYTNSLYFYNNYFPDLSLLLLFSYQFLADSRD